jgi:hypothetical protein
MPYKPFLNKMIKVLMNPSLEEVFNKHILFNKASSKKWRIHCLYLEVCVNNYLTNLHVAHQHSLVGNISISTSQFPKGLNKSLSKFCLSIGSLLSRFYPGFINGLLYIIISSSSIFFRTLIPHWDLLQCHRKAFLCLCTFSTWVK